MYMFSFTWTDGNTFGRTSPIHSTSQCIKINSSQSEGQIIAQGNTITSHCTPDINSCLYMYVFSFSAFMVARFFLHNLLFSLFVKRQHSLGWHLLLENINMTTLFTSLLGFPPTILHKLKGQRERSELDHTVYSIWNHWHNENRSKESHENGQNRHKGLSGSTYESLWHWLVYQFFLLLLWTLCGMYMSSRSMCTVALADDIGSWDMSNCHRANLLPCQQDWWLWHHW